MTPPWAIAQAIESQFESHSRFLVDLALGQWPSNERLDKDKGLIGSTLDKRTFRMIVAESRT